MRIIEEFNRYKEARREEWQSYQVDLLLQSLSKIIAKLQINDIDVKIDVLPGGGCQSFALFEDGDFFPLSGYIHIGKNKHLFGIKAQNKTCSLAVTQLNIDQHIEGKGFRVQYFPVSNQDFETNLMTFLISRYARHAVIMENDSCGVFGQGVTKPISQKKILPLKRGLR